MASGWVHATFDLIVFGRPYLHLHKEKDKAHKVIHSRAHRALNHSWYQSFGEHWSFENPFPEMVKEWVEFLRDTGGEDRAEEEQASLAHDYLDRIWDDLLDKEPTYKLNRYCEGFFAWVVLHPEVLKDKFGVDVLEGRIYRVIDGQGAWEECPETIEGYLSLRNEVERMLKRDSKLRDVVATYGEVHNNEGDES